MDAAAQLKNAKVIFVMGGPGSGKGTQCNRLVAKYGLTHLSSGDLLRSEVALGSPEGKRLRRGMAAGELVPLHDILRLLREAMQARAVDSPGFVIDGYPRSVEQGVRFEAEVAPCQAVIALNVPEEVMEQRLLRRGRTMDSEAQIARKLDTYRRSTKPALDYYARQGKLIWIDGSGSVDEVFNRVQDGLLTFNVRHRQKSGQSAAKAGGGGGGGRPDPARHLAHTKAAQATKHGGGARHAGASAKEPRKSGKSVVSSKSTGAAGRQQFAQGGGGGKASAAGIARKSLTPVMAPAASRGAAAAAPVRTSGFGSASVPSSRGAGAAKVARMGQKSAAPGKSAAAKVSHGKHPAHAAVKGGPKSPRHSKFDKAHRT